MLRDPGILAADLSAPEPSPPEDAPQPETWNFASAPEPEPEAEPEERADAEPPETAGARGIRGGALAAYLVPAIVIGLPVAVLLICIGLPFLLGGAWLIVSAIYEASKVLALLTLISDMLLVGGGTLIVCAVGLVLCWLGLWISMELCWLWVGKALVGLGRRLCVRKEAA